jgi:hypothetical protein
MALESTQPLTEMSTRNFSGRKRRPAREADNLTAICEPIVKKIWEPRRFTTLWAFMACYRDSFSFTFNLTIGYLLTIKASRKARNFVQWQSNPPVEVRTLK